MAKKDFIEKYAAKTGVSKKVANEFVEAFLETVEEVVVSGENVQFVGFGSFEARNTAERKGRNPKTGEEIIIPAKKVVKFKAGKKFQDKINM